MKCQRCGNPNLFQINKNLEDEYNFNIGDLCFGLDRNTCLLSENVKLFPDKRKNSNKRLNVENEMPEMWISQSSPD